MALVSIIVPCYNEETTIQFLLDALYRQTFPRTQLEIVIADGISQTISEEQPIRVHLAHSRLTSEFNVDFVRFASQSRHVLDGPFRLV